MEKWCLWEPRWEAGSPQMGRKGLRMGRILSTKLTPEVEVVSLLPSVPRDVSCHSTASCSAHWHTQRHRGFGEKSLFVSDPGRCHIQWVQDTFLHQGSEPFLPLQCVPAVLQGWEALTASYKRRRTSSGQAQKPCEEGLQLHRLILYSGSDIWRKRGSSTVCFPPFKAIQIPSAAETTGILSLPFFIGSSTENGAAASMRLWDGCVKFSPGSQLLNRMRWKYHPSLTEEWGSGWAKASSCEKMNAENNEVVSSLTRMQINTRAVKLAVLLDH